MSVRIEWHDTVRPTAEKKGYRAADGSKVEKPLCLFLGGAAYEGTLGELLQMLANANDAVIKAAVDE